MCELKVENLAVVGGVALGYEVRVTACNKIMSRQRSHEYNYTLRGMWYSAAQLQLTVILLHIKQCHTYIPGRTLHVNVVIIAHKVTLNFASSFVRECSAS